MDNQGELHKYFVIIFEKAWNANLYKCIIQKQLWILFKLKIVYFVLSKLQLNCYKRAQVHHTMRTRHPVTIQVDKSSSFSFFTIIIPPFFGITCIRLT